MGVFIWVFYGCVYRCLKIYTQYKNNMPTLEMSISPHKSRAYSCTYRLVPTIKRKVLGFTAAL